MIHNDLENEEFDKDEYERDLEYEEWWEGKEGKRWRNIERAINQIEDEEFRKKIEKLRESKEYAKDKKWELVKEFGELKTYEDKLNFWIEKGLSLFDTRYFDDLEGFKNVMLIDPTNDKEKSIYLIKLTEWINIVNEEEKDKSYQTLIEKYHKADINRKFIKEQIEIADNSVENIMREFGLEANLINNFLSMYQQKKNPNWYGLSNHCLMPLGFKIIAYKTSKVIGFVKYKEFLKGELENINEIEEVKEMEIEKAVEIEIKEEVDKVVEIEEEIEYVVSGYRTFRRNEKFSDDVKLRKVFDELINLVFIEKMVFDDFKKVFDYQEIEIGRKELKNKIIWKKEANNSRDDKKAYNWSELLTLIDYITDIDFNRYTREIKEIIICCFDFPDKSLENKIEDIPDRIKAYIDRENSNRRNKSKVEKIFDNIV
ncbi:hypothetical protein [Bergeyella zoohelcum]|nr:hypothetical protein [Bergeyella zoohelcum]